MNPYQGCNVSCRGDWNRGLLISSLLIGTNPNRDYDGDPIEAPTKTIVKAATEAVAKVATNVASCCEGCNRGCSEGCHKSCKLLRRLQQRLQATTKAATEATVKVATEVAGEAPNRGGRGSKSWRKGLRIMEEGVPNNGGRGSELNRGRRRRLHPLGGYGVTLYTNGKLRTRVTVTLSSRADGTPSIPIIVRIKVNYVPILCSEPRCYSTAYQRGAIALHTKDLHFKVGI
ncbi:hypothetical protein Tco_0675647 [Tanacetum coccineum]